MGLAVAATGHPRTAVETNPWQHVTGKGQMGLGAVVFGVRRAAGCSHLLPWPSHVSCSYVLAARVNNLIFLLNNIALRGGITGPRGWFPWRARTGRFRETWPPVDEAPARGLQSPHISFTPSRTLESISLSALFNPSCSQAPTGSMR